MEDQGKVHTVWTFKTPYIGAICKYDELTHDNVINILKDLNLIYSLREINKGLYAYCSKLHCSGYCFCRNPAKCQECKVPDICEKNF